ncbi:DUF4350 domain-containing protein [Kineococcus gynurae]|uniref:DUF4350 domain-containing protein n=1 Tax=Kineococcus gynurae TaxID=452979 RepID=A0ABV5LR81_9ACTN
MSRTAAPAPTSGPTRPPARGARRRPWLLPAVVVGMVLLLALGVAATTQRTTRDALSPVSVAPDGSRALARVLDAAGVDVVESQTFTRTRSLVTEGGGAGSAAGPTIVVTGTDTFSTGRSEALRDLARRTGSTLVLLAPDQRALDVLAPGVEDRGPAEADVVVPACADTDAEAAGAARAGGRTYRVAPGDGVDGTTGCYPVQAEDGARAASWVTLTGAASPTGSRVVVVGQPELVMNRYGAQDGNAALTLRTLGAAPALVWYRPAPWDVETGEARPLSELVPAALLPATVVVVLAGLTLALWRGRRFGRVVVEPLPVVVRSVETVEGRARLYHRAQARDRAAEALRSAAVARLRAVLRLDAGTARTEVADAVAWAAGLPPVGVRELLLSGPPTDDAALVALARDLDELERRVRRTS